MNLELLWAVFDKESRNLSVYNIANFWFVCCSGSEEEKGKDKRPADSPPSLSGSVDGTECRFNLSSYTRVYVVDKESIMYKREALLKAKEVSYSCNFMW